MQKVFEGVLFINNANLCSSSKAPIGRVDDDYLSAIKTKLITARDIAQKENLRIIFSGDLFRGKFDVSAVAAFIEIFGDSKPLVLASKNGKPVEIDPESSIGILSSANVIFAISETGHAEQFYIEGEEDTFELSIYNQLSDDALPLELGYVETLDLSENKTLIISSEYQESELEVSGCSGLLCSKWGSIANPDNGAYKFYAGDLSRSHAGIKKVSVTKWTEKSGFESIEIEAKATVFESDIVEQMEDHVTAQASHKSSEFARQLKLSSQNSGDNTQIVSLIETVSTDLNLGIEARSILDNLYKEVS